MTDIEKDPLADSRETHEEAVARVKVRNAGGLPGGEKEWPALGHSLRGKPVD